MITMADIIIIAALFGGSVAIGWFIHQLLPGGNFEPLFRKGRP